jgi:ketosteroid isomerase-like protein
MRPSEQVMSQRKVEVVREALGALDRRDVGAYLEVASSQIELINPASQPPSGTAVQRDTRDFFGALRSFSDASEVLVENIYEVRGRVLAFFVLTTTDRQSDVTAAARLAGVYDLENGKIRRARIFSDRAEAVEALRLSE